MFDYRLIEIIERKIINKYLEFYIILDYRYMYCFKIIENNYLKEILLVIVEKFNFFFLCSNNKVIGVKILMNFFRVFERNIVGIIGYLGGKYC